jgi:hypothetical protein
MKGQLQYMKNIEDKNAVKLSQTMIKYGQLQYIEKEKIEVKNAVKFSQTMIKYGQLQYIEN